MNMLSEKPFAPPRLADIASKGSSYRQAIRYILDNNSAHKCGSEFLFANDAWRKLIEFVRECLNNKSELKVTDLRDWFGPTPQPVEDLLELAHLRTLAARWDIRSIVQHEPDLIFTMESMKHIKELFQKPPTKPRILDDQTIYLRLKEKQFKTPAALMTFLDKLLENPPAPNVS